MPEDSSSAASLNEEKPASVRTTGLVALAVMCSRVLGLIREMIFNSMFDRYFRDCFLAAFRIPNLLRDLFAEGALSTAFVTVFSQKIKTGGDASAWALAHRMLTLTMIFMSIVTVLGMILARPVVWMLCGSWPEHKLNFTVTLTQWMFPFILMVSLAALVMGMLNSKKIYGAPAMASSFFNIVSIAGGMGLAYLLHYLTSGNLDHKDFGAWAMTGFSIGTLLGGLAQLAVQIPALRRAGYRFMFDRDWRDAGVQRILTLMWPSVLAGSAVQVNVMVNTIFATNLALNDGPVSWLNSAFRLMQLPLGVFGVTVATVTLPILSRVATDGITPKFREILGNGNRLVLFLTLPCAAGLFFLAHPIISVIFERGNFTAFESEQTAGALRWYAIGLIFYSVIKVIQPAFTAIGHQRFPMYVALASISVNMLLNSIFVFYLRLDHTWLAFTTAIVACGNCTALYIVLGRITGGLESRKLMESLRRLVIPLLAITVVSWAAWHQFMQPRWADAGIIGRCFALGCAIIAAGTAYIGLAHVFKAEEATQFLSLAGRKLKKR